MYEDLKLLTIINMFSIKILFQNYFKFKKKKKTIYTSI